MLFCRKLETRMSRRKILLSEMARLPIADGLPRFRVRPEAEPMRLPEAEPGVLWDEFRHAA